MKCYGQYVRYKEGVGNQIDIGIFVKYYYDNIQEQCITFVKDGKEIKIERPTPEAYFEFLFRGDQYKEMEYQHKAFSKILQDKELESIQDRLEDIGIQCCMLNMCYLCEYIKYLTHNRLFVLLQPQIKDTLAELKEVQSITFTNKDGSTSTSSSELLIKTVLDAANKEENEYEAFKMVSWNKIANNEIMQAIFVHELSDFLHSYFDIKRRKNAVVTAPEQELITYFLYMFKLSPAKVTPSRFRQLKAIYPKIQLSSSIMDVPSKNCERKYYEFDFVPYALWKNGKLDFKNVNLDSFELGDTIYFSKNFTFDID